MKSLRAALITCSIAFSSATIHASAAEAAHKTIIHYFAQPNASAAAQIVGIGATRIQDYGAFSLFSVPDRMLQPLRDLARVLGLTVEVRDDFDTILTAAGPITPTGHPADPSGLGLASYDENNYGLYLLQFIGPPLPIWSDQLTALNARIISHLNFNAVLVAATAPTASGIAGLPSVQRVEPYHPYLKPFIPAWHDTQLLLVRVADAPGADSTLSRLRSLASTVDPAGNRSLFVGRFTYSAAIAAIREPLVIDVAPYPLTSYSDERMAQELTPNTIMDGVNLRPSGPGYSSWLTSAAQCSFCGNLDAEGFRIAIADTGIDTGICGILPSSDVCTAFTTSHPMPQKLHTDFTVKGSASRVHFGSDYVAYASGCNVITGTLPCDPDDLCPFCDGGYHGTAVAGVAAGNGSSKDVSGYALGLGIAPSAGLVITKVGNSRGIDATGTFIWNLAKDAVDHQARILNRSVNQYLGSSWDSYGGQYTTLSQQFDYAGLGKDGAGNDISSPIVIAVSSGNLWQENGFVTDPSSVRGRALPPATAKNVIAAGAAESWGGDDEAGDSCEPSDRPVPGVLPTRHASISNMWNLSMLGTNINFPNGGHPYDTYIKPDLVVPATEVTSPATTQNRTQLGGCMYYGGANTNTHILATGTSFAAPAVAGAALIASRVYAESLGGGTPDPTAATPSLIKAMLLATTRSMYGGTYWGVPYDYTNPQTIGPAPNAIQGFGRLSIDDIAAVTLPKQYVNEEVQLTTGQQWSRTYEVSNAEHPVKVALAWSDLPYPIADNRSSFDAPPPNQPPTILVNDLDMTIYVGDGIVCKAFYGNNIELDQRLGETSHVYTPCDATTPDRINTVEKALIYPAHQSVRQFTVVVTANSTATAQRFSVFATNATALPGNILSSPASLTIAGAGTTAVALGWETVQGTDYYDIYRGPTLQRATTKINTSALHAASYIDTTPAAGTFYVYKVCAVDATGKTGNCVATSVNTGGIAFTDDPIQPTITTIKAIHITELRNAIQMLRSFAGLGTKNYARSPGVGDVMSTTDVQETRDAINEARVALGLPAVVFSDPTVRPGITPVHAAHIQELRNVLLKGMF